MVIGINSLQYELVGGSYNLEGLIVSKFTLKVMKIIRWLHSITSYLTLFPVLVFLVSAIASKLLIGRVLYFGSFDERNIRYNDYYPYLSFFLELTLYLLPLWLILSIINIKNYRKDKISYLLGAVGFILSIMLIIIDPFGLVKYLLD